MIVEVKKPSKYGKYFLSQEAPGDEESEAPRRNTKIIEIKARNRLKNDFTDGAEEPSEEVEPTDNEETPMNDLEMDNSEDFTSDEPIAQDQTDTETNIENDVNATNAEINANNNVDFTENDVEVDTDVTTQDDGMSDDNGPDLGEGEEDFTSDNTDTTGEEPIDSNDTGDGTGEQKGPGLEYDSTRKYVLFVNFSDLLVAIDNYISKLESTTNDDINFNVTIKTVTEKLREIRTLCYDYMTMKFEISSYIQSLLFYQNIIVLIQLSFNLLDKAVKSIKNKE